MIAALVAVLVAAEPAGLARVAKAADAATVDAVVAALPACKGKLNAADMRGTACRLAVVDAAVRKIPLVKDADIDARLAVVADALGAAEHVELYRAVAPEEGLGRARFDAHRAACSIAFAAVVDLDAVPAEFPGAARAKASLAGALPSSTTKRAPGPTAPTAPTGPSSPSTSTSTSSAPTPAPTLHERACGCAQRTVDLAVVADASPAETAEVQGVLTRQRCALGRAGPAIGERKSPAAAFSSADGALKSAADDASPEGRLVALARGRLVEVARCTSKHVDGDVVTDAAKLGSCACGVAKRWVLPIKKDDPPITARVPLREDDKLWLPIVVEGGVVARCGDVEGALLAR